MTAEESCRLLELAKRAAREAGRVALRLYDSEDYEHFEKPDDSPVTTADFRANEIITALLSEESPDIPIIPKSRTMVC